MTLQIPGAPSGKILGMNVATLNAVATGTTVMVDDDTIPQNTEGFQAHSITYTPKSASSRIFVMFCVGMSNGSYSETMMAIFRDSVADAIAANKVVLAVAGLLSFGTLCADIASPGTSQITFKIRVGAVAAATITINGQGGARKYGDIPKTSALVIEYIPVP